MGPTLGILPPRETGPTTDLNPLLFKKDSARAGGYQHLYENTSPLRGDDDDYDDDDDDDDGGGDADDDTTTKMIRQ